MKHLQLTADETVSFLLDPEGRAALELRALELSTTDPDFESASVQVLASNGHPIYAVRGNDVPRPREPEAEVERTTDENGLPLP